MSKNIHWVGDYLWMSVETQIADANIHVHATGSISVFVLRVLLIGVLISFKVILLMPSCRAQLRESNTLPLFV